MARLTLKKASKILKKHGFRKQKLIAKAIDPHTADWIKDSMPRKQFYWAIYFDKFLFLPSIIRYYVGIPGFVLDTWEPSMIDEHNCRSLNPTDKTFYIEEELIEILKEYETKARN